MSEIIFDSIRRRENGMNTINLNDKVEKMQERRIRNENRCRIGITKAEFARNAGKHGRNCHIPGESQQGKTS